MRTRVAWALAVMCGALGTAAAPGQAAPARGRLLVAGPNRAVFTEGFVLRARLTAGRRTVRLRSRQQPASLVDTHVPSGRYTLRLELRPCDANCDHLDPPLSCSVPVAVVASETTRVRLSFGRELRCRVVVAGGH